MLFFPLDYFVASVPLALSVVAIEWLSQQKMTEIRVNATAWQQGGPKYNNAKDKETCHHNMILIRTIRNLLHLRDDVKIHQ